MCVPPYGMLIGTNHVPLLLIALRLCVDHPHAIQCAAYLYNFLPFSRLKRAHPTLSRTPFYKTPHVTTHLNYTHIRFRPLDVTGFYGLYRCSWGVGWVLKLISPIFSTEEIRKPLQVLLPQSDTRVQTHYKLLRKRNTPYKPNLGPRPSKLWFQLCLLLRIG